MTDVRNQLRFILNDQDVVLDEISATRTLLDFLRLDRRMTGSKEGCAEGDCGACTVLVGRVTSGELVYESVNACICFVGSLDATHVVTVEHLSAANGPLHPVQQAMVEHHGSQCGFCTPGIVMSLYGMWMRNADPSVNDIEVALQGNLCRCTGYSPIIKAGQSISAYGKVVADPLVVERQSIKARLEKLRDGRRVELGEGKDRIIVPASADDLAEVYAGNPGGTLVSGATDVGLWVTKFMRDIGPMIFIGDIAGLQGIEANEATLKLGAGVTYSAATAAVTRRFPQLTELWMRIGGQQVRNMGTIGANIANGSPIGDTPPPLIALGAAITLRKGDVRREVKLEDFFIAYGKQDRQPGEFVEAVTIPSLPEGEQFACYKITKRKDEDISALCGAFRLRLEGGKVAAITIAYGGMAATPKRARAVEAALMGKAWTVATVEAAIPAFAEDYQPLTDMRASAEYRLLAAQNLLRRFFLETTGEGERLTREVA
ncbi:MULTISPECIES: xanthine dehydrogenase small subunit [unclassified Devosia]|uniref:xanthine dehydrogenase small subunit n=1 Tax=unclassified Devosia TaxID=196773 RepID=UPI00086C1EAB|nr:MULTISPECIES: xanthine dehydrogenase small subunit [unclassified Devosia]MBN9364101.1 xanthine dehydrogenase small subunit [Devosia sp.]ODS82067.1 MAG: xanthine dehydrogenase small subunit [Devosia sp. SCN 66-27]OJX27348.1 MAG: xanthine dehydrogenase small subunit [Devosia sp. 66-14]